MSKFRKRDQIRMCGPTTLIQELNRYLPITRVVINHHVKSENVQMDMTLVPI